MKPVDARAVMESRAKVGAEIATDSDAQALARRLELFPTPPWGTRALVEILDRLDPGPWRVWEPCCGLGHMAGPLRERWPSTMATDIHDWGSIHQNGAPLDFLSAEADGAFEDIDWIITNPPFAPAAEFVRLALRRAARGVAVLARLSFRETAERDGLFFGETPLTAKAVFAERLPMALGRWDPKGSTATAYAWFVWMQPDVAPAGLAALRERFGAFAMDLRIPVGTKRRLTRPDDARVFGVKAAAPLFEGMDA